MNFVLDKIVGMAVIPFIMFLIGYLTGRYIKPWIHANENRLAQAQEIALIADRITDEMLLLFPHQKWDDWLDKAVDKLIKSAGLKDADIARREIAAQLRRKLGDEAL
jgi:hypothetical protein